MNCEILAAILKNGQHFNYMMGIEIWHINTNLIIQHISITPLHFYTCIKYIYFKKLHFNCELLDFGGHFEKWPPF